jgi:hypothetical protein
MMKLEKNSRRLEKYIKFIESEFSRTKSPKRSPLKVHFLDLDDEVRSFEKEAFLRNQDLMAEDYGFHLSFIKFLKATSTEATLKQADIVVVPLLLPLFVSDTVHTSYNQSLVKVLNQLSDRVRLIKNKPKLILSSGDFSVRSTGLVPSLSQVMFPWINSCDVIFGFQSCLEDWHLDTVGFPLPFTPFFRSRKGRNFLYSFVGRLTVDHWPVHLARGVSQKKNWDALRKKNGKKSFVGTIQDLDQKFNGRVDFYTLPRKSVFTLCPRGIANWTFRLFEAIRGGSIPVVFSDSYIKPFSSKIPWDEFAITLPESDIKNVDGILSQISPALIRKLQRGVFANQHWFTAGKLAKLAIDDIQRKLNS